MELDAHALVAVDLHRVAGAHHDGGLHARHGGAGVDARVGHRVAGQGVVGAGVQRHIDAAHRAHQRLQQHGAVVQPGAIGLAHIDLGLATRQRAGHIALVALNGAEQAVDRGFVVGAQVVAGAVLRAQNQQLGLVAGGEARVVLHHHMGAGARGAPAAFGLDAKAQRVQRLGLAGQQALALVFGFIGVGAGNVVQRQAREQLGRAGVAQLAGLLHLAQGHAAVVGAGQGEGGGVQA